MWENTKQLNITDDSRYHTSKGGEWTKMSENVKTINPAQAPTLEKSKSLGIAKLGDKPFYITGLNHNRGQPTQYTRAEQIGEDGI